MVSCRRRIPVVFRSMTSICSTRSKAFLRVAAKDCLQRHWFRIVEIDGGGQARKYSRLPTPMRKRRTGQVRERLSRTARLGTTVVLATTGKPSASRRPPGGLVFTTRRLILVSVRGTWEGVLGRWWIPVSDRSTLRGLTQFVFAGSTTSP